ncbi:MAG: THUMP domain-containing protein [Conexivisphaerales archaeon]
MSFNNSLNFIATTYRNLEDELKYELQFLLQGFLPITYLNVKITGIVAGKLSGDPLRASKSLWDIAYHEPWKVKRVLRYIPIKYSCMSTIDDITNTAGLIVQEIPAGSTYKVEAELRDTRLKWSEVINAVAQRMIGSKAKMNNPDYYIQVQVLGAVCGISVLKEGDVFRALEAKLAGSEFP